MSKMTIGIFYNRKPRPDDSHGVMYKDYPQFRFFLAEVMQAAEEAGHQAVLLCQEDSYEGDKKFSRYWLPDRENVGYFNRVDETIEVDVIYDKGYFRKSSPLPILNVPELASLGRDKFRQSELFGKFMPEAVTITSEAELTAGLQKVTGEMIVLKPNDKNGGKGVTICPRDELQTQEIDFKGRSYVLQPFIDTKEGIPGLVEGMHDFRAYIMNGEVELYSVRQPQPGKLVANTSQGGTIHFVAKDDFNDPELESIIKEVDEYFAKFGSRYYSLDFLKTKDRWYLLEINDRPGILARSQSPAAEAFHKKLIDCIVTATDNTVNMKALKV